MSFSHAFWLLRQDDEDFTIEKPAPESWTITFVWAEDALSATRSALRVFLPASPWSTYRFSCTYPFPGCDGAQSQDLDSEFFRTFLITLAILSLGLESILPSGVQHAGGLDIKCSTWCYKLYINLYEMSTCRHYILSSAGWSCPLHRLTTHHT